MIHVYIIHCPDHVEREPYVQNITQQLQTLFGIDNVSIQVVWNKKGCELTTDELAPYKITGSKTELHYKNAVSLTLHHKYCLHQFLTTSLIEMSATVCIILEDDAFLHNSDQLLTVLDLASKTPYDSIFLGDGCLHTIHDDKEPGLIPYSGSRCTEAILYSQTGAAKVYDFLEKHTGECAFDWILNLAFQTIPNYRNFHAHPVPISQGTECGKLQSRVSKE